MRHGLAETIVSQLQTTAANPFTILTSTSANLQPLQADVRSWPAPSLAILADTALGASRFSVLYPTFEFSRRDGQTATGPLGLHDQFDAVLSLGPRSTIARLSGALCADPVYRQMRLRRMRLTGRPEQLRWYCANRPPHP